MPSQSFSQFGLAKPIEAAVAKQNYQEPTDIQVHAIPPMLGGRDVLATAQTGTGKTAAFLLPIIDKLHRDKDLRTAWPAVLILAPTRELAAQIAESASAYSAGSGVSYAAIFGGVSKSSQIKALKKRPQIVIATPGRLLDLIHEKRLSLDSVKFLILDEADRMLDMGFIPDVRRIAAMVGEHRQTALFSATMPTEVATLARDLLRDPVRISAKNDDVPVEEIHQEVLHIAQADKTQQLATLIRDRNMFKAIVFTRTKHKAARLAKQLSRQGITADSIHGDKTQNQRVRALQSFRKNRIQVLVATDIASRGIDVADITHVVNYDIPMEPESYVHRIGRTARAGASGEAISLCDPSEATRLGAIEKLQKTTITVNRDHEFHIEPQRAPVARNRASDKQKAAGSRRPRRSRRRAA